MKEGWVKCKLSDICTKGSSNISLNKIEDNNGNYALYGASGFVKGIDFYHQSSQYLGVVKDGSGVGRVNIYPPKSSLVGTMQYIFPNNNCLLGFLKYLLEGLHLDKFKTGAAIPHIYFKDYGKCDIFIPPLSEQQHIVEELDLLSSIIDKKKAQLKELDSLAQSIFYEMFGDPVTNEKGWINKKLKEVYKLKSGDGLSAKQFVEGSYPVYGGNGISGYHNAYNMDGNYIIIGRVGVYCGNVRLVKGKFWLTDNAFQLYYDSDKQIAIFVKYLLTLLDLHRCANKAAQPVISNQTLRDVGVLFPPLPLQQQFASKVEAIEHQKDIIKQSIVEVETLFNSRMDYYFN